MKLYEKIILKNCKSKFYKKYKMLHCDNCKHFKKCFLNYYNELCYKTFFSIEDDCYITIVENTYYEYDDVKEISEMKMTCLVKTLFIIIFKEIYKKQLYVLQKKNRKKYKKKNFRL